MSETRPPYPAEIREWTVPMVFGHREEYHSKWATISRRLARPATQATGPARAVVPPMTRCRLSIVEDKRSLRAAAQGLEVSRSKVGTYIIAALQVFARRLCAGGAGTVWIDPPDGRDERR